MCVCVLLESTVYSTTVEGCFTAKAQGARDTRDVTVLKSKGTHTTWCTQSCVRRWPFLSCLRRSESAALPEPEGFGVALRSSYLCMEATEGHAQIEGIIMSRSSCRNWSCPESRRASTLSGVGARHRLRGGSGRSNVIGLIDGALLHDLRVSDSQCTSARDPSHHPAACVSRPDAAHLPWSDRASDSGLRLRSRPYYHGLPRRLRKRCERSFY